MCAMALLLAVPAVTGAATASASPVPPYSPSFNGPMARGYGISLWMNASVEIKGYYGGWVWYVKADAVGYTGSGPGFGNLNRVQTPPHGVVVTNEMWYTPLGGAARLVASETVWNDYDSHGWYPPNALSKFGVLEACCGPGYYTHAFSAAINNHGRAGPGSLGWGVWYDQTFWVGN